VYAFHSHSHCCGEESEGGAGEKGTSKESGRGRRYMHVQVLRHVKAWDPLQLRPPLGVVEITLFLNVVLSIM